MTKEMINQIYDDKCERLLQEDEVRFAAIINEQGTLISGGFKKGLVPLEGDETKLKSFMEFVSSISIRKEFDESLISFPFPVSKIVLLISANPSVDIEKLAKKVVDFFSGIS
jgi:hypothetical protein